MAAPSRIVTLNLGMQTVTLAEFRATSRGALTLIAFAQEELIVDPAADATRPAQIEAAVGALAQSPARRCPRNGSTSACPRSRSSRAS